MGKSKIIYNGQTLIDLTGDTVTAETLLEGITAHGADGEAILGKLKAGGIEMLSGTFTPTGKTKTAQLGQALDLSGDYVLFILMVGTLGSSMSGTYHFTAGIVLSRGGDVQYRATCNAALSTSQCNDSAWTVGSDGSIILPTVYYKPAQGTGDMMQFDTFKYQWYFFKG